MFLKNLQVYISKSPCAFLIMIALFLFSHKHTFSEEISLIVQEQIEVCNSCHGVNGAEPIDENIPILAGQSFYYLYVQLKDLHSGLRKNEVMNIIASDLNKELMKGLAKHYSEKKWPRNAQEIKLSQDEDTILASFDSGQCTVCHMGQFEGNRSDVPKLSNQKLSYLQKTMLDMKNKIRMNAPAMSSLMSPYTEEEIKAMAEYLASL